jgi:hypothetical protein
MSSKAKKAVDAAEETKPSAELPANLQRMPSCTRCGKRDAVEVEEGIPARMCQECRDYMRQYQQTYRSADVIRARAEGRAEGIALFRNHLLIELSQSNPSGLMQSIEVQQWIAKMPAPEFKDQTQS